MNPKSTDIFGRLSWLTKAFKNLCCRLGILEQLNVTSQANIQLDFFWSNERDENGNSDYWRYSDRINGHYKLLGIKFNNLVFEPDTTYTLLIDRWRHTEGKGNDITGKKSYRYRKSRFYHELSPGENNRMNEIPITSSSQLFDFNQDYYFYDYAGITDKFPKIKGYGRRGLANVPGAEMNVGILKLGFRIRMEHPTKGIYETPILKDIIMIGEKHLYYGNYISYRNI